MMKKILLLLTITLAPMWINAENILQVIPFTTTAGVPEDDWEEFYIEMTNEKEITAMQFDLYLPVGIRITDIELNRERFNGTVNKKTGIFTPDAVFSMDEAEDGVEGHYLFTLYDEDLQMIKGNSGAIIIVNYETSDDMPTGVYPIKIKSMELTHDPFDLVRCAESTSYVKIVSEQEQIPSLESLNFSGYIPSFVVDEINKEESLNTLDFTNVTEIGGTINLKNPNATLYVTDNLQTEGDFIIIKDGICDNFTLTDGYNFSASKVFTATNVSYNAAVSTSLGYKTLVLPYDCDVPDGFEAYEVGSLTGNTLNMVKVQTTTAGKPVILKNAGTAAMAAMNVTINATNGAMLDNGMLEGTYTEMLAPVGSYVLQNIGGNVAFYPVAEGKQPKVGAFRAYLTAGASQAKALNLNFDGTVTGIDAVEADMEVMTYNINGQRISNNSKGLRIVRSANGVVKKM